LIYLATCTRPDIAYAVSKVSKYLKNPTEKDWIAVKRILRYLKGIQEVGLVFGGKKARKDLEGWVDADWAGDVKSRLSRSGYVFKRLQLVQSVGVPSSKRMLHFQLRKLNMLVVIWELKKLFR